MKTNDIKISAFCLTTNAIQNEFPFIESIKSFLPIVDELIVVDGGSTDGTIEAIQQINDSKIRIINDEDVKWEKEWAYGRMGHNFNRGLQECTGDWVIKFDVDYILHEKGTIRFREDLANASKRERLTVAFTRMNFILADRFYVKSKKTLAINKTRCREVGINLKYGLDLKRWGWGFDFIDGTELKDKVNFGSMLREGGNSIVTGATVFNYDFCLASKDIVRESRWRHELAVNKQQLLAGLTTKEAVNNIRENKEVVWNLFKKNCLENLERFATPLEIEKHPEIIQDKIKNLSKDQQGYNCWGWTDTAKYYE